MFSECIFYKKNKPVKGRRLRCVHVGICLFRLNYHFLRTAVSPEKVRKMRLKFLLTSSGATDKISVNYSIGKEEIRFYGIII